VRLLGVRSTDESAFGFGRKTVPPQPPARSGPETPPPQAASAAIKFKPNKPGRTYLQQLVLGKNVRVQYDPYGDDKDKSRAYVFLPDGTLVNAEMLRKGLARVDASRPFAHQEEFEHLEKEAQASASGRPAPSKRRGEQPGERRSGVSPSDIRSSGCGNSGGIHFVKSG